MVKIIYLEGMACLGKSTALKRLSELFPDVGLLFHDYFEMIEENPHWSDKHESISKDMLYSLNHQLTIENSAKNYRIAIADRHPISTIIYNWIFSGRTIKQLYDAFPQDGTDSVLMKKFRDDIVIVGVTSNFEAVNQRIMERGRFDASYGIGIHEREYEAFVAVANMFKWEIVYDPELSDFSIQDKFITSISHHVETCGPLITFSSNNIRQPYYMGDGGYDVVFDYDITIKPGETKTINSEITISTLPLGLCGVVSPRSSFSKLGLISQGLIDNGYRGPLYFNFTNVSYKDITVPKGVPALQIMFPTVVSGVSNLIRGEKCLGSSSCPKKPRRLNNVQC